MQMSTASCNKMEGSHLKLHWNTHSNILVQQISQRFSQQQFVDVVLFCEGKTIKCHRLVLAAYSLYFDEVLSKLPKSDLVLVVGGMKFSELNSLVTFMYTGEITVRKDRLNDLSILAEKLKIKGLSNVFDKTDAAQSEGGGGRRGQGIVLNVFCNREGMVDLLHGGKNANESAVLIVKPPKPVAILKAKSPKPHALSRPKKLRYILPKMVGVQTQGIRKRGLELPQMPTLIKRPNLGQPKNVGVVLPIGLMTPSRGANRESGIKAAGVAIGGPILEGAAANNAVPGTNDAINSAHNGSAFAGKDNQILMMNASPSSTKLTSFQSGIPTPTGQFVETASQPCHPFTFFEMEMERERRMYHNVERDRKERLKKAVSLAQKFNNTKRAAAKFSIPRTTLIHYMKRQREDTMLPQGVMLESLLNGPLPPVTSVADELEIPRGDGPSSTFITTDIGSTNGNGVHFVNNDLGLGGDQEVANRSDLAEFGL
ncbi:unnamed protein product [Orchesella dallaii]|uniref:BTB domain-containing protein n=1 Tax=Orchesella dallaii TaxID=48710 RepID=A0ABP1RTD8_9HEXA